jgi:hypothetical protein
MLATWGYLVLSMVASMRLVPCRQPKKFVSIFEAVCANSKKTTLRQGTANHPRKTNAFEPAQLIAVARLGQIFITFNRATSSKTPFQLLRLAR